ncbi:MAG: hypothetical protein DRI70_02125 [Bacteroidetes bacterium]|nr:MAG: hypothetical protein DRI70_02125 [Bacteroidota bacterium]
MIGEIACPVCNSNDTKRVYQVDAGTAGSMVIPDNPEQSLRISEEIESLWQSNRVEFLRCTHCMFGFAWPFLAGNDKIYSALYYKDFSYPADKWEYDRAIEIIGNLDLSPDSSLLELGAGNGSFLDKVATIIQDKQYIYSTEYSNAGVEEIKRKGYNCFNKSISDLPAPNLPEFDIICMFQVLEHMDDLKQVFQSLDKLCKETSHVIIAVPNGTLRRFYDRMGVHLDVPPIHVGSFTPKTFHFLGKKHGWEVIETCTEPQKYLFKLKKFVFDRYARNRLAKRTEGSKIRLIKYFFRYLIVLLLTVRFLPIAIYLLKPGTGTSLLVHLKNQPESK